MRELSGLCLATHASPGHSRLAYKRTEANREELPPAALQTYLERRGDLCLVKFSWPIDVPDHQAGPGARDAVQMPVLEKLGLVSSSDATTQVTSAKGTASVHVKRYELTDAGRKYYIARPPAHGELPDAGEMPGQKDLCVAHLSLATIVDWKTVPGPPPQAVVTYTYEIDAAPWTRDPDAERVFPAVARVVRGAGSEELKEGFTLTDGGWVANELLGDSPPPARSARPLAPGNP